MCGIAGIVGPEGGAESEVIRRMVDAMHHRGPDDSGFERMVAGSSECWLGSARLSIIDLSRLGHMPMVDDVSGNWITFNGEVYNHPELRRELEAKGERFVSRTDTEVVLRLYRLEGEAFLRRLRGMFAFALWDASARELLLARDRAGKKPLYYVRPTPGTLLFASEVRTLLASGRVDRKLDQKGLEVYLANGFLVSPSTLIDGVRGLLPGHSMRVDALGVLKESKPYWRPRSAREMVFASASDEIEGIREEFRESSRRRLISDVPLGIFLSGGMDSSAILGALGPEAADLRTFSIGFPEQDFDESGFARKVSSAWKTRHTEAVIGRSEFFDCLPDAFQAMDLPTFDGINTYLVSRAAAKAGLKVAVSGIGADELFGGYPFFRGVPALISAARLALPLSPLTRGPVEGLAGAGGPVTKNSYVWNVMDILTSGKMGLDGPSAAALGAYQSAQMLFPSWARRRLMAAPPDVAGGTEAVLGLPRDFVEFVREDCRDRDPAGATSLLTWRLFLGERCLRDSDTMSMAVSLELRAPFTDHNLVDRVLNLPGRVRCAGAPDKPFEAELLEPFLRGAWEPRKKRGFVLPYRHWLNQPSSLEMARERLGGEAEIERCGLDAREVETLRRAHASDPTRVYWSRIWAILALVEWCRRHGVAA